MHGYHFDRNDLNFKTLGGVRDGTYFENGPQLSDRVNTLCIELVLDFVGNLFNAVSPVCHYD